MIIRALVKAPGLKCREANIQNDFRTFQRIIGGHAEAITIHEGLVLLCDEEGKLKDLKDNFPIYGGLDRICGTCIFVGADGEDFTDISDDDRHIIDCWLGIA